MNNLMIEILKHYDKNEYKKAVNKEQKLELSFYDGDTVIHSVTLEEQDENVLLKEIYSEEPLTFEDFGMFLYWFDQ